MGRLLPIGMAGQQPSVGAVDWFIDGLLPEGNERTHRADAVGVDPDDTFSMISRPGLTGSEVGAVMGVSEQRASQLLRDAG